MPLSLHCYFLCVSSPFSQIASTVGFVFSVAGKSSRKWTMRCFDGVVTVVDADNDAHGKYLLSFQNLSGIYNKRWGRPCLPRRNFLRKSLRFCPSPRAVGSQNRTASGENPRRNKKARPVFWQDARKITHFKRFCTVATTYNRPMGFIVGIGTLCHAFLINLRRYWWKLIMKRSSLLITVILSSDVGSLFSVNSSVSLLRFIPYKL